VISFIFAFGLGIFLMFTIGLESGCGVIAFWFFVYYGIFILFIYYRNNKSIPRKFILISVGILAGVCFISLIVAAFTQSFNDFLGFSITYLVLNLLLFFYSIKLIYNDLTK